MPDKVFLATLAADALFLASGALELGFCLITQGQTTKAPKDGKEATRSFLIQRMPLTVGIVNAVIILATFMLTLPGLLTPARAWLKLGGYMVTVSGVFTLCVGVYLWVMTLHIKEDLFPVYLEQDGPIQSLIQTSFGCCGYMNSSLPAFVTDSTCPSPAAARLLRGCATSVSNFSNVYLDNVFTALFGMVGVDTIFLLCLACLLKVRKERDRYRHIDEKSGFRQF